MILQVKGLNFWLYNIYLNVFIFEIKKNNLIFLKNNTDFFDDDKIDIKYCLEDGFFIVIFDFETSHTFMKSKENKRGINRYEYHNEQITAYSYSIIFIRFDENISLNWKILKLNTKVDINHKDFFTHDSTGKDIIEKNKNKVKNIIIMIINDLLINGWNKNSNVYFYSHNFFRFDSTFCLNLFIEIKDIELHPRLSPFSFNPSIIVVDYTEKSIPTKYYKVSIITKKENKPIYFIFKCSYKLTNISLESLVKRYLKKELNIKKDKEFPHALFSYLIMMNIHNKKINTRNINYISNSLKKYRKTSIDLEEPLGFEVWKNELLYLEKIFGTPVDELKIYVERDVLILTYSFIEFLKISYSEFPILLNTDNKILKLNILSMITAPRLSLWLFLSKYKSDNFYTVNPDTIRYEVSNKSFYGGITVKYSSGYDIYKHNLIYSFDFSSAYVNAIIEPLPCGIPKIQKNKYDITFEESVLFYYKIKKSNKCFFCYLEVDIIKNNVNYGLPYKEKNIGKTIFPSGIWEAYYNSKDLESLLIENNKFKILSKNILIFNLEKHIFFFGNDIYIIKSFYKKIKYFGKTSFYKLIGNSLYGKLGSNEKLFKYTFHYDQYNKKYFILIKNTDNFKKDPKIPFFHYFDSFLLKKGIEFVKTEDKSNIQFINKPNARYITSITRWALSTGNTLLKKKYIATILYNDTDSIFFFIKKQKMDANDLAWKQSLFGKNLEQLNQVLFLGPKTYALIHDNKWIFKLKGVNNIKTVRIKKLKILINDNYKFLEIKDNLVFISDSGLKKIIFLPKALYKEGVKKEEGSIYSIKRIFIDKTQIFRKAKIK